jgi:hypothetical protein
MRYLYSVVRFVPDPGRGEFVNVGILAGSDESSEWEVRTVENLKRARSIDDKGLVRLVWGSVDDIGRMLDRYAEDVQTSLFSPSEDGPSEGWLTRLSEEARNVVQFSPPAVIVADTLSVGLDILFKQFIVEPETRQFSFKKKHLALAAIRRAYREAGLRQLDHFNEGATVKGLHHQERFDFLVANGRVVQLAQTWSFQVPSQDDLTEHIKAWAWTVEDVRDNGGEAMTAVRRIEVPRDVDIEVIYVPPSAEGPRRALEEALAAFGKIGVKAVETDRASDVALQASRLIGIRS